MPRRNYKRPIGFRTKNGKKYPIFSKKNTLYRQHQQTYRNLLKSTSFIFPIASSVSCAIIPHTCLINLMINHHEYIKTIVIETYNYVKTKQEDRPDKIKGDAIQNLGDIMDKNEINNISNKIGEKFSYYINENEYTDKVPEDLSLIIGTETSRQILSGLSSKAFNWASRAI